MSDDSGTHGFDPTWWEERYRSHDGGASHPANPHLVEAASELAPGTALDAGCGEGTEALWLARHGWHVVALDVSATALDRARQRAEALGPDVAGRITWVRSELADWAPPADGLDLVCSHYAHPTGPASRMVEQLAAAVRPGGTLLVVGHQHTDAHAEDHGHGHSRGDSHPDAHGHGPARGTTLTPDLVTATLDPAEWDVLVAEHRSRRVPRPDGHDRTLEDAVVLARRR